MTATQMDTVTAGRYVLDTLQRLQMGDLDADEAREAMRYIRSRTDAVTYEAAKAWAAARDAR